MACLIFIFPFPLPTPDTGQQRYPKNPYYFTVSGGRDKTFHDRFSEFSLVARPIFERMQAGESTILDAYAATNYQEF